jgi:hypothetical protein
VLEDPSTDAAAGGLTLLAEATFGAHFERWKLETVELGARARGPSQCSPVTRISQPTNGDEAGTFDPTYSTLSLRFGETNGKSPPDREAECAAYTTVPVAYVLTAIFAEDFVPTFDAGPDAGTGPLIAAPVGYPGAAKGLGVINGIVYWRFEQANGLSGIALGFADVGSGSNGSVSVEPTSVIAAFDVDRHVVFQDLDTGRLQSIKGGDFTPTVLANSFAACSGLASDNTNVYCRAPGGSGSTLYSWPVLGGASQTTVYNLPVGGALAVDDQTTRFYLSDETSTGPGQAVIRSAPRNNNGNLVPSLTPIATDQTGPRSLTAGMSNLFWIDARGNDVFSATSASKFGSAPQVSRSGGSVRFIAADPLSTTGYFIGIEAPGVGNCSILRAFAGSSSTSVFRSGITGLGGIAVDAAFVYWTESNGNVYRALKNNLDD